MSWYSFFILRNDGTGDWTDQPQFTIHPELRQEIGLPAQTCSSEGRESFSNLLFQP
jgi:hypothetical protein